MGLVEACGAGEDAQGAGGCRGGLVAEGKLRLGGGYRGGVFRGLCGRAGVGGGE